VPWIKPLTQPRSVILGALTRRKSALVAATRAAPDEALETLVRRFMLLVSVD